MDVHYPPPSAYKRGKRMPLGLFTLLSLHHFGTIKHVSDLSLQKAWVDVLAVYIFLSYYSIEIIVHSSKFLHHDKCVFGDKLDNLDRSQHFSVTKCTLLLDKIG